MNNWWKASFLSVQQKITWHWALPCTRTWQGKAVKIVRKCWKKEMKYSIRCITLTDSFSAESRGWGDNVWLPGPLPWRLQQTWGGGDVRCSRLCKVIHNEKKKRQTILNIDNVQKITNSKTLRLLGPGQDYSKLLGSMGGQGLYHPFMQVGKI